MGSFRKSVFLFPVLLVMMCHLFGQEPVLRVDLNIPSRQEAEVNEPGYIPWPLSAYSKTMEGVTFEFKNGTATDSWYKAGVQSPYYARLVNDGIKTERLELHITGLARGRHSLVTFHNTFDNPASVTFSPMDIFQGEELVYDDLELTNRVTSNDSATTAYFEFDVEEGDTVILRFQSDPKNDTASDMITICGFHLNTSDPTKLVRFPFPADKDEHVDIDNDTLVFSWVPPSNTVSHNFYTGTDLSAVLSATPDSPEFQGSVTDTFFISTGFYSMESYFWRVDPITSEGDTTKGDVWYFKKRIPAFPEAGGYGRYAIGGRGGEVIYVTNLNDDGPGSFRDAVENHSGPRTILFQVSGLITLRSRLVIRDNYITVAGQSAPGKGVCFRWAPLGITGNDLIVQNLRVRLGIGVTYDGMGLTGAESSIIDHCSVSWTIDEAFSSRGAKNITLQRTLISEALNAAGHDNYPPGTQHGYAASIGGDIGSFHHNLLAHCEGRNWSLAGGLDGDGYYAGRLDIFNNVVYNWGGRATDGGAHQVNFVNNYYKKGKATVQSTILKAQLEGTGLGSQSYFYSGNVVENISGLLACDGTDNTCSRTIEVSNGQVVDWQVFVNRPFFDSEADIHTAYEAFKRVLSDVGCVRPAFDDHDNRIIQETLTGSTSCVGSYTGKAGLPDHENDVGGWEPYPGVARSPGWDTDLDGLPNWWENAIGLDTSSVIGDFTESNADPDKNGYTHLEEYLQWMDMPHHFTGQEEPLVLNLAQYARGFTDAPEFEILNSVNGQAVMSGDSSMVTFTPLEKGMASFEFRVTDAAGSSFQQTIGVYVGETATDSAFSYSYFRDRAETDLVVISPTSVVDKLANPGHLVVYPNPAAGTATVQFQLPVSCEVELYIYNSSGSLREVIQTRYNGGDQQVELHLENYRAGLYFIQLKAPALREGFTTRIAVTR